MSSENKFSLQNGREKAAENEVAVNTDQKSKIKVILSRKGRRGLLIGSIKGEPPSRNIFYKDRLFFAKSRREKNTPFSENGLVMLIKK